MSGSTIKAHSIYLEVGTLLGVSNLNDNYLFLYFCDK